jgi:hypothetical protein
MGKEWEWPLVASCLYCLVFRVVTHSNGFWIRQLALLTPSFTITPNHQQCIITHSTSSKSALTSCCLVTGLNSGYSSAKFSLSVSRQWILTQELQLPHSRYHCTTVHIKSSNHTLGLHWRTSYSSPTTNVPWLCPTDSCLN